MYRALANTGLKTASLCLWLLMVLLMAFTPGLHATQVLKLTLEELVSQSDLIFAGRVTDVTVFTEDDLVYSTVTFAVDEVVNGADPGASISLRFMGGSSGGVSLEVEGQDIPQVGAQGLFFVTDVDQPMVNPLTGWSQGYFPLLRAADGVDYLDLRNHPDYGLVLGAPDPLAAKMHALRFNQDQIDARFPDAMQFPLADFLAAISEVLRQQSE